jgi:hypothetical protein
MAVPPATYVPTITPAEMQILVSRTGLVLNPGQVADLVLAWRQIAGLIASLPRERPLADDMALTFRLVSQTAAAPQQAEDKPNPTRRAAFRAESRAAKSKQVPEKAASGRGGAEKSTEPKRMGRSEATVERPHPPRSAPRR